MRVTELVLTHRPTCSGSVSRRECVVIATSMMHLCTDILTRCSCTQNKKSRWVVDRSKIARRYLSHGFWIDLLCALPLDWFVFAASGKLELSSLMRMPKMAYVVAAFRETRPGLFDTWIVEVRLYIFIMIGLHFFSCILFVLGNTERENEYTWYKPPAVSTGGPDFEYTGFGYSNDPDNSPWYRIWKQYLLCFYWVTSTVTTTGVLGDMFPKNSGELIFAMIMLLAHITIFNYVVGLVSSSVLKGDEHVLKMREEIGRVESYLNSFDFDEQIKQEIKRHFQDSSSSSSLGAVEILDSVSTSLRLEISSKQTGRCLDECTLFYGCSSQLKDSIKGLLREVTFDADELLFQVNTVADEMFFLMSGTVNLMVIDQDGCENVEAKVGSGGAVGVLASYFGMRHTYSAQARSAAGPCMCLRLVRSQLMQILDVYPDDEELTAKNAMNDFRKIKQTRTGGGSNTNGGQSVVSSRHGGSSSRGGASDVRSRQSRRVLNSDDEAQLEASDEGSEKTMVTQYEQSDQGATNKVEAVKKGSKSRVGGMEQMLNDLHVRRRAENIAAFCHAASQGQVDKLARAIRYGVHVDDTDANGRSALHCASSQGQVSAVRFLIEAHASPNIKDHYSNTPLNDAVLQKHDNVAMELRRGGASRLSMPGFKLGVLMCTSAWNGDKEQLRRMLNNRVDVNTGDYDTRTALHLAASSGHVDVVEFLLQNEADVNCRDRMGFSALADAVRHEHKDVQKLLLAAGGKLLGMDEAVELCTAAAEGNVTKISSLLEGRANPNAKDYDGRLRI